MAREWQRSHGLRPARRADQGADLKGQCGMSNAAGRQRLLPFRHYSSNLAWYALMLTLLAIFHQLLLLARLEHVAHFQHAVFAEVWHDAEDHCCLGNSAPSHFISPLRGHNTILFWPGSSVRLAQRCRRAAQPHVSRLVPNVFFKLAHDPDSVAARDANLCLVWFMLRIG